MKLFYIIIAILILLLMITIHEFGHYIAGKILGFKIDEFSIGFGPKLFSRTKKNGEVFSIRALPLGGFCAFAGETEEENILAPEKLKKDKVFEEDASEDPAKQDEAATSEVQEEQGKKFNDQPPWKRIIVLMAGGVFNLLSAVVFSFIFIVAVGATATKIDKVYESVEPQFSSNFVEGDNIVSIDGKKIDFYHSVSKALQGKKQGDTLKVVVLRGDKEVEITATLSEFYSETQDEEGNELTYVGLGIRFENEHATLGDAFKYAVPYTAELSWLILGTFGDLIVGKVPLNQVSGPIGTVNQMANLGMESWAYLLLLLPLIAANLGIFNLFPIPALDGSKVVFTVIEWIRGKPIDQKIESMIHFVGLIVLFGLVMILDVVNIIMSLI